jgi:hypothetical protein
LFVYFQYAPPYLLLLAGLLAGLASGSALSASLEQLVQCWRRQPAEAALTVAHTQQLLTPFLGIALGSLVFLASGIQIFGFPWLFAYAIATPLILFIGRLLWSQLVETLDVLSKRGSRALDLDVPE